MKILFISAVDGISGAEIVLLRFLRGQRDLNPVVLLPSGPLHLELSRAGHRVYVSRGLGKLRRNENLFWPLVFVLRWVLSFIEIVRLCKKESPKIIQATHFAAAIYAALPAKLLGIPLVWHVHDILTPGTLGARVAGFMGKRVNCVVAVSCAVKEALIAVGVPGSNITVVHNGIDSEKKFHPGHVCRGTLREQNRLDSQMLLVGFVGLLVPWKGAHFFLEAVAHARAELSRPVRFLIIGDSWSPSDPYKEALLLQARGTALEDLVIFTGRVTNIPAVLADLDVVVHASLEPDPLPNVVLEAMAMKKLILASEVGGVPEMIEDGVTGLLYTPGDVEALAQLLQRAVCDFEALAPLGRRARRVAVERFNEARQRAAFARIYREVTTEPRCSTGRSAERIPQSATTASGSERSLP